MDNSLMPEIAKLLGVEMGEVFSLKLFRKEIVSGFYFDRIGLQRKGTVSTYAETLGELLQDTHQIIKLPFKPKEGDIYYSYMWSELLRGAVIVNTMFVSSDAQCRSDYMLGNCYRTEAECEADTAMKERIEKMERCKW